MKRKRLTEEQVIGILRQAERGEPTIGEICRAPGVSEQSFYRRRRNCGGLHVSEVRRMNERERETASLKRLLAERDLEIDALKELLVKKWPAHRRLMRPCASCTTSRCRHDATGRCSRSAGAVTGM